MDLNVKEQVSIGGLRANAAAALINLSFFTGLGILIPILALILETENKFVRNYAKQTLALSVFVLVTSLLNIIIFIGSVVFLFILFILTAVQIFAIVKSVMGEDFEIPYIQKITGILFVD